MARVRKEGASNFSCKTSHLFCYCPEKRAWAVVVSFLFAWLEYGSHIFATWTFLSGSSAPLPPWALSFHHRHQGNSRDTSFLRALHISTLAAFVPELTRFFVCTPLNQLSSIQNFIRYSTLKKKKKPETKTHASNNFFSWEYWPVNIVECIRHFWSLGGNRKIACLALVPWTLQVQVNFKTRNRACIMGFPFKKHCRPKINLTKGSCGVLTCGKLHRRQLYNCKETW